MPKDKNLTRNLQVNGKSGQATLTIPIQIVRLKGWKNKQEIAFVLNDKGRIELIENY